MAGTVNVIQGTLDLLILKALAMSPIHAWGIGERIRTASHGRFNVGQGSLYPALYRFEQRGWVNSLWRQTRNNRIARYYELTPDGRRALEDEIATWRSYVHAIESVIAD
jgi:transcriptional regulator